LCEYQECSLGNLIADAMKDSTNTEIAFLCGGDIKNNMLKGNLTNRQLIDVMPFYNNIIVKRIHGQDILDALEYSVSSFPNPFNGFLQISGIIFDLNTKINNEIKYETDKIYFVGERRVSNVKVNGEDLNLTKLYNVSMFEFIGNGGYGYSMFTKYNIFSQTLLTDTECLIHYIKYNLKGEIPEKYKDFQRRIILNNTSNSQVTYDNQSPKITLITIHSYKYSENPYMIEFYVIVLITNYPEDEVYSLAMKLDIEYVVEYVRLRFLEDVTCIIKSHQVTSEIYDFYCSKEVRGIILSISIISDNLVINGKEAVNSSTIHGEIDRSINKPVNSIY
jgi:hypothetical protein